MSEKQKQISENIEKIAAQLNDAEADKLLAYTEGMAAMAGLQQKAQAE